VTFVVATVVVAVEVVPVVAAPVVEVAVVPVVLVVSPTSGRLPPRTAAAHAPARARQTKTAAMPARLTV
jgi:hypothetical protein